MSATSNQPTNKNFLSPFGFKFLIKKAPHLNFFVQSVNVPSVSLGTVDVENPFVKIPFPGDKLSYSQLDVTFKVDEDLKNYFEVFNWLVAVGYPDNFEQRRTIEAAPAMSGTGTYSDISLSILTSSFNGNYEVVFKDCYPTSLGEIQFDSTMVDLDYVTCTASFAYRSFSFTQL